MVYSIFLQYLGVAINKAVFFCIVVSKKKGREGLLSRTQSESTKVDLQAL